MEFQGYVAYDYSKYPTNAQMIYASGNNTPLGSTTYEMYQQQHASPINGYSPCTSTVLPNGNVIPQPLTTSIAPISYPQPSPALAASTPYRYANNSMPNYVAPQIAQVAPVNNIYSTEYDITQADVVSSTFDESLMKSIVNAYESAHQIYLNGEADEPALSIHDKQQVYLEMACFK